MEQRVIVRKTFHDGTAEVMCVRQSACSGDCHQCAGCGAEKETLILTARNPIQAKPGDTVILSSETGPVLKAAAVLYMMPMALFFLGFLVGALLWDQGALTGGIAFCGGIALVAVYDRKTARKQDAVYTITGYPAGTPLNSRIKGDNDCD